MEEQEISLKIIKLNLRNFIDYDSFDLEFEKPCTVLMSENLNVRKLTIIKAIKFIVGNEFLKDEDALSLRKQLQPGDACVSYVKITFECKTNQEHEVKNLEAWRSFDEINKILYQYNGKREMIPIQKFQHIFELNTISERLYLEFNMSPENVHENLLNFLGESGNIALEHAKNWESLNSCSVSNCKVVAGLLYHQKLIMEAERKYAYKLFKITKCAVNEIFKILTDNKYELNFLTYQETNSSIIRNVVAVENLHDNTKRSWTEVEDHMKFLVQISVKIAIASFFEQKFIFIENTDLLKINQNLYLFHSLFTKQNYKEVWENLCNEREINYLQRIIDICNEMNISGFFEFPGITSVKDCNIYNWLKENGDETEQTENNDALELVLGVMETEEVQQNADVVFDDVQMQCTN